MFETRTVRSYVDDALAPARFALVLIGIFAGIALVLAAVGLYGVISYSVRQRTRELGIRIVLGAGRANVVRMVLGQGLALTLAGVVLGLIGAVTLSRFLSFWLYGVAATDPLTYGAITLLLLLVATAACYVPARRASRAEPAEVLQEVG